MTDGQLEATLAAARRAAPVWNAGRQQQLKWATAARLEDVSQARDRRWLAAAGGGALALVGLVVAGLIAGGGTVGNRWHALASGPLTWTAFTSARSPLASGAERALPRLADGTSIVLDGPTAILKKTLETSDEVGFLLEAGGAHFEVARRPSRSFRVHAGAVTVHVIGTRFHVQRQMGAGADGGAHVSVDRGRVLVSWWGGARELGPGESGTFPPAGETNARSAITPAIAPPAADTSSRPTPVVAPALEPQRKSPEPSPAGVAKPETLFARADRARGEGKPEAALVPLREIVSRYPRDPHASAAAFTVGRLLLESLGRPREAALAFAQARALAKDGPLGEDALAREVEAWHAAGDGAAARQRADLYRQLFPAGPRSSTVARFGGSKAVP